VNLGRLARAAGPAAFAAFAAVAAPGGCRKPPETPLVPPDYRTWARVPPEVLRYPVPGHFDNARVTYINAVGAKVTRQTRDGRVYDRYPEGTIIVKEVLAGLQADVTSPPERLTVMIKSSGHRLARGGWLWVTRDPATGSEQIVDWGFCYECHADANEPHPYGDKNPNGEFRDDVFFPYRAPR
jgi:hypothetical protein